VLASDFAQRMLPQIFRAGDPVLELALPPEKRQELETILERLPREVFIADDSLGWVYQFWQADQKDAVNASENKIGADELPAVTQLFTEDYMVLFLLHNTLGAWWGGKVLAGKPELARTAVSEDECRAACAVQGVDWRYLRFVREKDTWRPAAGTLPGWPTAAKGLTVLDPCMGSGHFLAFALPILVALRQAEEKLSISEAVDAVLRDNLFGLELDPRCTQIAAFNVGLTAWKLAGYRPLPAPNLACAGLAINASVSSWTALAAGDAVAENAMKELYELFRQAPTLGSLIDPTRVGGELFVANFDKIRRLLASALATEESEDAELAVVAQGIAKAATILAERYTLVVTNPPYLLRRKQNAALQAFSEQVDASAKGDLAVLFLSRLSRLLTHGGVVGVVQPQNWMFLTGYRRFRETFLRSNSLRFIACLGPAAFQDMNWWAIRTSLVIAQRWNVDANSAFRGFDLGNHRECDEKPTAVRAAAAVAVNQHDQLKNPDARILVGGLEHGARLLSELADSSWGVSPADLPRFGVCFWELRALNTPWVPWLGTVESTAPYGGREMVLRKDAALDAAVEAGSAYLRGTSFWGKKGIAVRAMGSLPVTIYTGEAFDANVAVIVPRDQNDVESLWAYAASGELATAARALDQAIKVTSATFTKIGFDAAEWRGKAAALPVPESAEPTQWLFAGHPRASSSPLHVAVARLLGYRWPRQAGSSFMDSPAVGPDGLESHADADGIVCLSSLRGEAPAAERVRALLADAFDKAWSAQKLNDLLASTIAGSSLDDWLRDGFFEQHCALFHQRPFVWQIWDGRKDGFSALVNYHQLAAPNGEGRRILDKLTHTYLGDWLDRQRADQKAGVEGADGRVAAAEHLKRELEKILEGEPPYDLFVRWKPLHRQPVGWEPDLDDGVRVNIRPFMTAKPLNARGKNACILRVAPKVKWDKDRGKEPTREKAEFPWFWGWDGCAQDFAGGKEFDGNRWNDLHYSRSVKLAARERPKGGKS